MKLDDFSFGGFTSFSRVVLVRDTAEAKKVAKFLGDDSFNKAFDVYGAGKYYIHSQEGWDRGGDYSVCNIAFIPEEVPTWENTMKKLKSLKKEADDLNYPFVVAEELRDMAKEKGLSNDEAVKTLSPKDQKAYASMDVNACRKAENTLENFLNGHLYEE